MKKFWFNVCFLLFLVLWSCGSSRKLTENPEYLGIIPFSNSNLNTKAEELNTHLFTALKNSGSFYLNVLDSSANFYSLSEIKSYSDTSLGWILTGKFDYESIAQDKGKIPVLIYKPNITFTVKLTYRLYNREKNGWVDIGELVAKKKKGGRYQLLEFDQTDPSLMLSAIERQKLRTETYAEISEMLIKKIESKMNIKK